MPGVSIIAELEGKRSQHRQEKLSRRKLRDASDPLSFPNAVLVFFF